MKINEEERDKNANRREGNQFNMINEKVLTMRIMRKREDNANRGGIGGVIGDSSVNNS